MIRVLQVGDYLRPRAGIASFLLNYNSVMDTNRVVFDYLIIEAEEHIKEKIEKYGGKVYYMPKLGLSNIGCFCTEIKQFFENHKYHIVHSHFYQIDSIVKFIACRNGTKHYISHSHSTKYADNCINSFRNYLMSLPMRFASTEFCGCSVAAGNFLFGKWTLKLRNKELHVIPNAIDYKKFSFSLDTRNQIREKYRIKNKKVFGNLGRFYPPKNHLFLLDVFYEICKLDKESVLMLVGDGVLKNDIVEKAKFLGVLDKVIFVGATDHPQDFYNAFDCFIFPSLYEGFGLSLLEAEVNGLPCVCANTIPKEPIVSKNVEILSLKNSSSDWASVCLCMLEKGRNEENLSRKYDLPFAADDMMKFYEDLL